MQKTSEQKRNRLFIVLAGIFITNALLAEMIGVKIFSAESTVGLEPAHLNIFGFIMDFNLTAGVVIWPVVFITTDLINEYYGKPGVKLISYLTVILIAYAFVILFFAVQLNPAQWWLDANNKDASGNSFNIDFAFGKIFGQGQRIIIASIIAFLLGQLTDVYIFQKLKHSTGSKYLWLRATGSTLVSQFIDSFVVLYIAFSGIFSVGQINAIGITNYIYKFCVAILLTPVIYAGHAVIDRYLGKDDAARMQKEAAEKSKGFF
jgi:queuosine precursor transporter